jgi:hypothetical protein
MPRRDNLGAALDEWGVQWRPEYGMKAALSFWENCSYVHAYDDEVFPETLNEVNRIEIIGDPQRVRFLLNGRELFAGERPFQRSYRQIELKTRAGAVISNLANDNRTGVRLHRWCRPASTSAMTCCMRRIPVRCWI